MREPRTRPPRQVLESPRVVGGGMPDACLRHGAHSPPNRSRTGAPQETGMKTHWSFRIRRAAAALALLAGAALPAMALPAYSGVTFFGDSLSDTGNVLALTSIFQPPAFPNYPG